MKKETTIKLLNLIIVLLLIVILTVTYKEYKQYKSIPCFGLQAPPENYALLRLIPYIGIMLLLPALLILIRHFVFKKSVTKNNLI